MCIGVHLANMLVIDTCEAYHNQAQEMEVYMREEERSWRGRCKKEEGERQADDSRICAIESDMSLPTIWRGAQKETDIGARRREN